MSEKTTIWSNFVFVGKVFHICLSAPKKDKHAFLFVMSFFALAAVFDACIPIFSAKVLNHLQDSLGVAIISGILIFWTVIYVLSCQFSNWFLNAAESLMSVVFFRYNTLFCQNKTRDFFGMPALVISSDFRQKAVSIIPRIGRLGENMIYTFIWFLYQVLRLMGSSLLLIGFMPLVSLIILPLSVINVVLHMWINNKLRDIVNERLTAETEMHALCQDALENANNIRSLGLEKVVWDDLQNHYDDFHSLNQRYKIKRVLAEIIPTSVNILNYLFIVFLAIHFAFEQKNIGVYVMLTGLSFDVLASLNQMLSRFKWLHMNGMEYMSLDASMQYNHDLEPKFGKGKLAQMKEIVLEDVSFTYPEEKAPILEHLSLKIKAGSRVAIIGNSGMGKSTLINVMQHAYEIQSGKVKYNGKDVRTISKESLRDNLSYIDQHPTFWNQKTIKENLLMFNPQAKEEELYQALSSANLLDEIMRKEKKLDAKVTALSAGQKQRLSLARALLRHTPIVIMDEPTANLDTHAQTKVLEGIRNLSKVKGQKPTVIFASNVPAEIASANRILLLENGQIVEDGTPKKLMNNENSKTYKRLKKYKALFVD